MIRLMKNLARELINRSGWELHRKPKVENTTQVPSISDQMKSGLSRISRNNIEINTIIDVGAACGTWSIAAQVHWPNCSYLLLEPLKERKETLSELVKNHDNWHLIQKAAGDTTGKINFYVSQDLDGSGIAKETDQLVREVVLTTIDLEVDERKLKGPFMIKLDTHGFELPILKGCSSIIENVSLFVIECYGFRIATNSLLFGEMCMHMDRLGFKLIDIVDVLNRPNDGAFWQCDAIFINKKLPFYQNTSYN